MNSNDFLVFAKSLNTDTEAHARSCVSRAYYCAYHAVKGFMEQKLNIAVEQLSGGTHERISKALIQDKNNKLKFIGYKMLALHGRRVMADYHLSESCSSDAADEAIVECEKILLAIIDFDYKN